MKHKNKYTENLEAREIHAELMEVLNNHLTFSFQFENPKYALRAVNYDMLIYINLYRQFPDFSELLRLRPYLNAFEMVPFWNYFDSLNSDGLSDLAINAIGGVYND